jgi:hypothetical protein
MQSSRSRRAEDLMQQARAATSLDEFGEDGFREGLEILLASADEEARLSERGRAAFEAQIVNFLSRRLEVERCYAEHPEIDEQEITAPLIGLGLPRTGSTALSFLLAQDAHARVLRTWEAIAPCPPPDAQTQHDDPRITLAKESLARREALFPRMKIMLPATPDGPTECQTLMGHDFKSQIFQAFARIPSYAAWLNQEADLVPTYRYVKRVLKLLQWHCPPTRWRLKSPTHMLFIEALAEVFPDARFWMTHRDVGRVLPSVCDVYLELSQAYSDHVDKHDLGRQNAAWTELGLRRLIAFRDAGREHCFFDVHFEAFQQDPLPILEQLYTFLGEELTDATRARMQAWREAVPRDRHGLHRCEPGDFGIDLSALRERFRFYSQRFGLPAAV